MVDEQPPDEGVVAPSVERRHIRGWHVAVVGVLAALLVIAGIVGLLTGSESKGATSAPRNALVGSRVSGFQLPGLSGGSVSAPWSTGHPAVVVFFASWCGPCHAELRELGPKIATSGYDGVAVVGVDGDFSSSSGIAFVRSSDVRFPVGHDSLLSVSNALFKLPGYPATVFVKGNGVVSDVVLGALSTSQLERDTARLR